MEKDEVSFKLEGKYKPQAEGLKHFEPPKKIQGKHNHGIKPSLTFFFENEEQKAEVYKFFKAGTSRVPSGKKLLKFVHEKMKESEECLKDLLNTTD